MNYFRRKLLIDGGASYRGGDMTPGGSDDVLLLADNASGLLLADGASFLKLAGE